MEATWQDCSFDLLARTLKNCREILVIHIFSGAYKRLTCRRGRRGKVAHICISTSREARLLCYLASEALNCRFKTPRQLVEHHVRAYDAPARHDHRLTSPCKHSAGHRFEVMPKKHDAAQLHLYSTARNRCKDRCINSIPLHELLANP